MVSGSRYDNWKEYSDGWDVQDVGVEVIWMRWCFSAMQPGLPSHVAQLGSQAAKSQESSKKVAAKSQESSKSQLSRS